MSSSLLDFGAGIAGGTAMVLVGQPLDTVKVKMQTSSSKEAPSIGGVRGLYAGSMPAICASVAEMSVMMMTYGHGQQLVAAFNGKRSASELSTVENALAGAYSGLFTSVAMTPFEHLKCRLQTLSNDRHKTTLAKTKVGKKVEQ